MQNDISLIQGPVRSNAASHVPPLRVHSIVLLRIVIGFVVVALASPSATAQFVPSWSIRGTAAADLRVTNLGEETIHDLRVTFPGGTAAFGDIAPGATSPYKEVRGGVYRYAAYTFMYDGKRISQPVVDWMGESPLPGRQFTYQVTLDPALLPFPIRLVRYTYD